MDDQTWAELKAEAALERRNPSELADDAFRLYLRMKKPTGTFPSAGGPE